MNLFTRSSPYYHLLKYLLFLLNTLYIGPPLHSALSHMGPLHRITLLFHTIHLNNILPSRHSSSNESLALKVSKYKKCRPFDIHGCVHRRWRSRNTNMMQICNRIYYSKVYWSLNKFRAAHRSSSGALNCICSLWFIYTCKYSLELLMMSGGNGISHSALTTAGHHMGI
jgi:hypothetical protein